MLSSFPIHIPLYLDPGSMVVLSLFVSLHPMLLLLQALSVYFLDLLASLCSSYASEVVATTQAPSDGGIEHEERLSALLNKGKEGRKI